MEIHFFFLSRPSEYLTELREYGTVYSSWAECEEELQRPLEGVAGCVATCCRALEDQSESMSQDFLPVLKEYVLYIESMKVSALRVRRHVRKENDFKRKNTGVSNNKQVYVQNEALSSSEPAYRKCLHVSWPGRVSTRIECHIKCIRLNFVCTECFEEARSDPGGVRGPTRSSSSAQTGRKNAGEPRTFLSQHRLMYRLLFDHHSFDPCSSHVLRPLRAPTPVVTCV